MNNSIFLFTAFSTTWAIIFVYVLRLFKSQKALNGQIDNIKKRLDFYDDDR